MFDLAAIRFVLVEPAHAGNIGAAARAMKNMGLSQLVLVNPQDFPSPVASKRAAGADDILAKAKIYNDLGAAIADCQLVFATSARARYVAAQCLSVSQAGRDILTASTECQVAVLFGRERSGLTNEEMAYANYQLAIPANPDFSSLNLSQAVQVVAYELRRLSQEDWSPPPASATKSALDELATHHEVNGFYQHLQQVLLDIGFVDDNNVQQLLRRLQRLYNRSQLEVREVNILRGILSAVSQTRGK